MKHPMLSTLALLFCCTLLAPDSFGQKRKRAAPKPVDMSQQAPQPNVSGDPNYLTAPSMNSTAPTPQPQPIQMNIKKQRKVRVVPAPPPPGPITPTAPPKESYRN